MRIVYLLANVSVDALWTGGIALAAILSGVAANLLTSSHNASKISGAIDERMNGFREDVKRLEEVDDKQWAAINSQRRDLTETREDVAELKGRLAPKVNGAAGGRP